MKYKTWKRKTLKSKKFRKAYIKLLERLVREYERLAIQSGHQVFSSPEEIKRYRKSIR